MFNLLFQSPKEHFPLSYFCFLFFQTAQIPKVVNYTTLQNGGNQHVTKWYQPQPAALTTFYKTTTFRKQERLRHNQRTCKKDGWWFETTSVLLVVA